MHIHKKFNQDSTESQHENVVLDVLLGVTHLLNREMSGLLLQNTTHF